MHEQGPAPAPDFEEGPAPEPQARLGFFVDLEGFEGPLDLLLTLARQQKLDIKQISILQLAEQYLEFISEARRIRLEIAADYLVMAAWLAYLKSRLLLPEPEGEDEPSGEELAARLQHQLRRLEAMREAADKLMARSRLGLDVFPRGAPEGVSITRSSTYECSLYDLLSAYGTQMGRNNVTTFKLRPLAIMSVEEALRRLSLALGELPDWASLEAFLPQELRPGVEGRSAVAATFSACLELAKQGKLMIRQGQTFGPIYLKGATSE
ncbi:MAG TPA: ScpA family protein [Alphaproteobacteria bacterium]|nr:ScpA family protein [Alphaproteobacteria bacterium]